MKKIYLIIIIVLCMYLFIPNINAKTVRDLREELEKYEKEAQENNADIQMNTTEIEDTKREISNIYSEVENIINDIKKTEEEIIELGVKIDEKDKSTKILLSSLQKTEGNSFYIEYLFGAESIEDFIYRYAITEELTEYNNDLILEMQNMIKESEEKKVSLSNKKVELEDRQTTLSSKLSKLEKAKVNLYEISSTIEEEIRNAKQTIKMYKDAGCEEDDDINTCANKLLPADTKFYRPFTTGYVTSEYGYRDAIYDSKGKLVAAADMHEGIDLSNGLGKNNPIYASANGKVASISYTGCGGNQIVVHHNINGKTYTTCYLHLSKILVNKGDIVTKDTIIGYMGSTGCSTGYHLHFSISTGLRYTDYTAYSTYVARSVNPRTMVNFPSRGSWKDRITYYS